MYFSIFALGVGILLLSTKASFAQSAPNVYPAGDEDEEAVIDSLASLSSMMGPQVLSNDRFPDYDVRSLNPDLVADPSWMHLPRKFAYKPDDIRFYIPADLFPDSFPNREEEDLKANQEPESLHSLENNNYDLDQLDGTTYEYMAKRPSYENRIPAKPSHIVDNSHSVNRRPSFLSPMGTNRSMKYDVYYIVMIVGCSAAAAVAVVAAGVCWYKVHERVKAAADVDYPAYGITGPSKSVSPSGGDRKLVQSAHMYHYQHQKQQMAALQKNAAPSDRQTSACSDVESDDDNEEGDYTVYECPGLAPAGDMEVKNPLYQDEQTPASPKSRDEAETKGKQGKSEDAAEKGQSDD